MITPPAWSTALPAKATLFADDTYFVEGWQDGERLLGRDLEAYGRTHSYLLVKPEALLLGKLPAILGWLRANEWHVVAAREVRTNRHTLRRLWRYHWNAVTRQHKDVVDLLFAQSDSLFLLLRSATTHDEPATQRLAAGKGPAKPAKRSTGELRELLGNHNAYLNFVHSPDEPADLFRELAVLFDAAERALLLDAELPPVERVVTNVPVRTDGVGADLDSATRHLARHCGEIAADVLAAAADPASWTNRWGELHERIAARDALLANGFAFVVFATYLTTAELPGLVRHLRTVRTAADREESRA
ncbi:nucleoside-diphosphate kinase [Lentzea sp. NPDC051838]|uniref:nucleoside-diphosphate kinase n=1 Tax=Lentzea sp. NPDC051838 TaxID=3154849 RepID=UPI00343D0CD4